VQSHEAAVSLFWTATLISGHCILPKATAALHWFWFNAHLYKEQIFTGVFAVPQGFCHLIGGSAGTKKVVFSLYCAAGAEAMHTEHYAVVPCTSDGLQQSFTDCKTS